jgi:starch synthase
MRIFFVSAECKPFSKAGGVGDVSGELPPELRRLGLDVHILTPLYGSIRLEGCRLRRETEYHFDFHRNAEAVEVYSGDLDGVPVHFFSNPNYFHGSRYGFPYVSSPGVPFYDDALRFSFFSEACLHYIRDRNPDIVHVNDWTTCFLPGRLRQEESGAKTVLTVHNIGYQGNIGIENLRDTGISGLIRDDALRPLLLDPRAEWNSVNPLRLGLELADAANTVSPEYCREITLPEDDGRLFSGGRGLHEVAARRYRQGRLVGILNGFRYSGPPTEAGLVHTLERKASTKRALSGSFPEPDNMLLGFVGRAVDQKLRLLAEPLAGASVLEHLLEIPGVNLAFLAAGEESYERFLQGFAHRDNVLLDLSFDSEKATRIGLGSDVFLMPSVHEPCGIAQMQSMSQATPPLVRWTGGLADTVVSHHSPRGTGFGFDGSTREEVLDNLLRTVREALSLYRFDPDGFRRLQRNAFFSRFRWDDSGSEYLEKLYRPILSDGPVRNRAT